MKPNQILDEAKKYLLYVSDALGSASQSYSIGKQERDVIAKYSADIQAYAKGLEDLTTRIVAKEKAEKKIQVLAVLENRYTAYKSVAVRAKKNLQIVENQLKEMKKAGTEQQIQEVKARVDYYIKQNKVAQENELIAKRDLDTNSL
jgi:hypothetical protein